MPSGDIGDAGTATDNAYHVIISSGAVGVALLDGFTVTGAYSRSSNTGTITVNTNSIGRYYGGGMYNASSTPTVTNCSFTGNNSLYGGGMCNISPSSPVITNCSFTGNEATFGNGGGMYNTDSSSPTISNCSFTENIAVYNGGGMFNTNSSSPIIHNSVFAGNKTTNRDGGGMFNQVSSSPAITNCKFTGNTASFSGGGMYCSSSSPTIINSIFTGNTASTSGGGVYNGSSSPMITNTTIVNNGSNGFYIAGSASNMLLQNSIIWDAFTVASGIYTANYSLIKGLDPSGTGNIDARSLAVNSVFSNYSGADYTLPVSSPAINAGNNAFNSTTTDLAGNPRVSGAVIDLGAYEYQEITPDANNIVYVNIHVPGGNRSGDSWTNAIPQLSDALKYARIQNDTDNTVYDANPLKIYVAKGTYKPLYNAADGSYTTDGTRDNAFVMVKNVQVYGGFDPDNNITDLTHNRVIPIAPGASSASGTVLSGNIGTAGTNTDNTFHVVISAGAVGNAVLDGFTITGAYSTSSDAGIISVNGVLLTDGITSGKNKGGGMHNKSSSPTISNCNFTGNTASSAAGMFNNDSSSPTITNCSFTGNTASGSGSGMYNNSSSSPAITSCIFTENTANSGGGMYNHASSPGITNSIFIRNTAISRGGGMYNTSSSSPLITNTTIANNGSNGIYITNASTNPVFHNSIVWETVTVVASGQYTANYSLIKGANPPGTGNIDAASLVSDAVFADYPGGDYTLKTGSPAIDKGYNTLYPGLDASTRDLAGNPRLVGSTIDMGAYESPDGSLPVTLLSFTAEKKETSALLQWKTATEQASKGFEIEHSANAREWTTIGFRASLAETGSSGIALKYAYTHSNPAPGKNYYRLKQTDFDGSYEYSPIRMLAFSRLAGVKAYPNPAREAITVELGAEQVGSRVRLVSTAGVVLQEITVQEPVFSIPLSGYPAGIYLLHTADGKVARVVKE